ncbi:MAG: C25 family peptidase propeptide domain-containing protein, partial [Candidatus Zixiibacteriota bacterium]
MVTAKALNGVKGFILASAVVFLLLGVPTSAPAAANQSWISLIPSADRTPRVSLLQSGFDQVEFEIQIPGMWSEEITTKGGEFTLLSISNSGVTSIIGEPNLPVITRMIQIPFGAEVSLNVESFQVIERSLDELGITTRIAPVQPPVPKIEGAWQQTAFAIDQDYYGQNAFLPETRAEIVEIGVIRGHRFVTVAVHPVSYNPQAGRVRIYSDIRIKLTLSGSDMTVTKNQLYRYASPPFERLCEDLFVNYETYAPTIKGAPQLPIGYLIITLESFVPYLTDLVEWKTKKGFHVTVAEIPDIGISKEAIKSYIEDAYDNWLIPPTYVLFVGDVGYIPHWTGSYSS